MNHPSNPNEENHLSEKDIESFLEAKQDFLSGKTTAKKWEDIEYDLNQKYNETF